MYKYSPNSEWLKHAVDLLDRAYTERRHKVIELLFSKPIANLRVFAGAFRYRKDDSGG